LYCQTARIHADIKGEDVATVMMEMGGATVTCNMSYASRVEHDRFPETFVLVEGSAGSVELAPDHWLRVTTLRARPCAGCHRRNTPGPTRATRSCIPASSRATGPAARAANRRTRETHAADNLRTMELVFAAYDSAREQRVVEFQPHQTPN
jgi:predicted dehydrogenase